MIPQYLNEEHVKEEVRVAEFLSRKWKCTVEHQHKFSSYDCVAHVDQKPKAFIELRIINFGYYDLETIMISLTKLIAGKQQTELTGVPSLFVVHWKNSGDVGWVDVNKINDDVDFRVTKKNTNRLNHGSEIEVCRYIKTSRFNMLGDFY